MASKRSPSNPTLPWEATLLVAHHLDPKTLAVASCVSKPWHAVFSSDDIWKPICLSRFPSSLHFPTTTTSSYHSFFSLLLSSSAHLRRRPPTPRLALRDLLFAVDVFRNSAPVLSFAKSGDQLALAQDSIFRFDVDVGSSNVEVAAADEYRVAWTVVMKGFQGAFSIMQRVEKGKLVEGNGLWFTGALPNPECCSAAAMGGGQLEAELGMEFGGGDGRRSRRVEKVRLGLMSILSWRYLRVEDGLLYLQHFLLPA
ncbi:probable F-box protein At5g04010 [Typha angustifolia]|uniref:probable F-box protein At5g04010 n=1 Tax=Typha angustifolia TaxID=59011 RepID=UPI003C2E9C73